MQPNLPTIAEFADILAEIERLQSTIPQGDSWDGGFLNTHVKRFTFFLSRLEKWMPALQTNDVLEIGSYHLHLSILMSRFGYNVYGVDLPVFVNRPVVVERALEYGIVNRAYGISPFGKPVTIPYADSSVDAVVCTEVLEHITFNPIGFWSEVHRTIRDGGLVLVTTPNALSLVNVLATLKRVLTLRSIGIDVMSILTSITSGHHWKEYSLHEIDTYFKTISPDFERAGFEFYTYRNVSGGSIAHRIVRFFEERVMPRRFLSELFIVVRVTKRHGIVLKDPDMPAGESFNAPTT